ncbi:formimidoylglutamate deiminase [Starkeya sp. ORNL1]|uniref:formimidoylglutamate deiminase n=1 Tax=Starkeya sp. ORNL1 TaxID=2709380 RepID=UPI0014641771|nr:formimidoylglutamate deiminase [Starkeya sp. ORNL1]QJP17527.1 formimidoylglutamate deiminase [Starkeya sp. ORNL1]
MMRLWFERALLPTGWADAVTVEIANGLVAGIAAGTDSADADERYTVAIPGLPNLHSHAFQRAMAGLTEVRGPVGDSFWTWREQMYRTLDRLDPDDMEAIANMAYVEMLEAGFTRVGEFHYVHHDRDGSHYADIGELAGRMAAAAASTGIGLTLLPVFYAHGNFGGQPPNNGQRRFINDPESFARLMEASARALLGLPDAVLGLAPHSLRAATAEEIAAIVPLAQGGPLHIHVAEQTREVDDCLAWCGRRPVELLFETTEVGERWCLIHATHMTHAETVRLAHSGAVAGLCPITEANLGDGIFPADAFVGAGGRYGVGSDSNVLIDAASELRMLEYSQRLARRARNVMAMAEGRSTGTALFDAALAGGAQALGAPSGIAVGNAADMVSLDAELVGENAAALDRWIFATPRPAIDCVWRRGERLVERGVHRDRDRVTWRFAKLLDDLAA